MPRTIYTVAVAYRLSDRVRPVGPTTEEPTLIRGEFESWRAARPYAYIVPWPDDDRWPQARTCERKRRRNAEMVNALGDAEWDDVYPDDLD
jgi:hypothetical protein